MKFREQDNQYIIRLEKGEELLATLTGFCAEHDIKSGWITSGIGGIERATVGYFNTRTKKYVFRRVKDAIELTSLNGNISEVEGKPFLHLHATVSSMNNKVSGGHVHHIITAGTIEVLLSTFTKPLTRSYDDNIGLKLLDL